MCTLREAFGTSMHKCSKQLCSITRPPLCEQNARACCQHRAPQSSSGFVSKYMDNHVTYVSAGAGGTTQSSRYTAEPFSSGNMRAVHFLCIFVTFTVCLPSSHSSISKQRQGPPSVRLGAGALPAIPSATGRTPLLGCSTQHRTPTRSSSCFPKCQACASQQNIHQHSRGPP